VADAQRRVVSTARSTSRSRHCCMACSRTPRSGRANCQRRAFPRKRWWPSGYSPLSTASPQRLLRADPPAWAGASGQAARWHRQQHRTQPARPLASWAANQVDQRTPARRVISAPA